jgi:hypothetical protein
MISSTSCVTTMASPKNFRTVLKVDVLCHPFFAIAFQASSIRISFRTPLQSTHLIDKIHNDDSHNWKRIL